MSARSLATAVGESEERRQRRKRPRGPSSATLFVTGGADHIMPPSVNKSNARHYKSNTVTEVEEFPGRSHWTCGEPGWEAVAERALEWALAHAAKR